LWKKLLAATRNVIYHNTPGWLPGCRCGVCFKALVLEAFAGRPTPTLLFLIINLVDMTGKVKTALIANIPVKLIPFATTRAMSIISIILITHLLRTPHLEFFEQLRYLICLMPLVFCVYSQALMNQNYCLIYLIFLRYGLFVTGCACAQQICFFHNITQDGIKGSCHIPE
jgi:hypothetical protein